MKFSSDGLSVTLQESRGILCALRDALSFLYSHRPPAERRQRTAQWFRQVHLYGRLRARLQEFLLQVPPGADLGRWEGAKSTAGSRKKKPRPS